MDLFQAPDYFQLDDLLSEEHKLVREAAREWVKREVSPIIEDACEKAEFPNHLIGGLAGFYLGLKIDLFKRISERYHCRWHISVALTIKSFPQPAHTPLPSREASFLLSLHRVKT